MVSTISISLKKDIIAFVINLKMFLMLNNSLFLEMKNPCATECDAIRMEEINVWMCCGVG